MNNPITNIITKWIEDNSRVIDFGCGDGSLLTELRDKKNILGYGIEIDPDGINDCL